MCPSLVVWILGPSSKSGSTSWYTWSLRVMVKMRWRLGAKLLQIGIEESIIFDGLWKLELLFAFGSSWLQSSSSQSCCESFFVAWRFDCLEILLSEVSNHWGMMGNSKWRHLLSFNHVIQRVIIVSVSWLDQMKDNVGAWGEPKRNHQHFE